MVEEARLEQLNAGLTPVSEGWFVVNVRDGAWVTNEASERPSSSRATTHSSLTSASPWPSSVRDRRAVYHREANQEDFLVLAGECLLLIEGEERPLKAWDFVHCPPDTEHGFVGAGERPVRDLHDRRAKGMAGEGHRLPALRAGAPPWRRRGAGDDVARRGVRLAPEVAAGPPETWDGLPWA